MSKILVAALAIGAAVALSAPPAEASGGCGPYRHRTLSGFCAPGGQWGWGPGGYYGPRPYYAYGYGYRPYYGYGPRWRRWHRYYW